MGGATVGHERSSGNVPARASVDILQYPVARVQPYGSRQLCRPNGDLQGVWSIATWKCLDPEKLDNTGPRSV